MSLRTHGTVPALSVLRALAATTQATAADDVADALQELLQDGCRAVLTGDGQLVLSSDYGVVLLTPSGLQPLLPPAIGRVTALLSLGPYVLAGTAGGELYVVDARPNAAGAHVHVWQALLPSPVVHLSASFVRRVSPIEHTATTATTATTASAYMSAAAAASGGSSPLTSVAEAIAAHQHVDSVWVLHDGNTSSGSSSGGSGGSGSGNGAVVSVPWLHIRTALCNAAATAAAAPTSSVPVVIPFTRWSFAGHRSLRCLCPTCPTRGTLFEAPWAATDRWAAAFEDSTTAASEGHAAVTPAATAAATAGGAGGAGGGGGHMSPSGTPLSRAYVAMVTGGAAPALGMYYAYHEKQGASFSEVASLVLTAMGGVVSGVVTSAVRVAARDLRAAIPTPIRSVVKAGLHRIGAGSIVSSISSWLGPPGSPAPAPAPAAAAAAAAAEPEPEPEQPMWSGSAGAAVTALEHGDEHTDDADVEAELAAVRAVEAEAAAAAALQKLRSAAPRAPSPELEFSDADRVIHSLVADPTGRLVLAADGWGRVLLIDASDLSILHLWKGRRAAQLGWILHSGSGGDEAAGLYAVIYAPRRGEVELWRVPGCIRVRRLKVGRSARLAYTGGCMSLPTHDAPQQLQQHHQQVQSAIVVPRCVLIHPPRPPEYDEEDEEAAAAAATPAAAAPAPAAAAAECQGQQLSGTGSGSSSGSSSRGGGTPTRSSPAAATATATATATTSRAKTSGTGGTAAAAAAVAVGVGPKQRLPAKQPQPQATTAATVASPPALPSSATTPAATAPAAAATAASAPAAPLPTATAAPATAAAPVLIVSELTLAGIRR